MTIVFNQLAGSQKTPAVMIETDLKSGLNAVPSMDKAVLLLGHKTSAGAKAVNEPQALLGSQMARDYFGVGSDLAMMADAAIKVFPKVNLWGMAYAEGGGATAGSGTFTITGPATGPGTLVVYVAGRRIAVGIANADTATVIGEALEAAINAITTLPVTANNVTGTVTLTSKNKGPQANTIRIRGTTSAPGTAVTASGATLASGATAGDPTTALTKVLGQRFHLIVLNTDDDTAVGAVLAHAEAQSTPSAKRWGVGIAASVGSLSTATTLATGNESYRQQVAWLRNADQPVWEVAAAFAAERARVVDVGLSLDGNALPGITAPFDEPSWPSSAEVESVLGSGVTPLAPQRDGTVQVVRSVVTKSTTAAYIDHNITEISDYQDEDLIRQFELKWLGKKMKFKSPAGTTATLTPARAKLLLYERLRRLDALDLIEGVEDDIKAGQVLAEPNAIDPNRMDIAFPYRPVARAHVIAMIKTYTVG